MYLLYYTDYTTHTRSYLPPWIVDITRTCVFKLLFNTRRVSAEVCAIIITAPSLDNQKNFFRVHLLVRTHAPVHIGGFYYHYYDYDYYSLKLNGFFSLRS